MKLWPSVLASPPTSFPSWLYLSSRSQAAASPLPDSSQFSLTCTVQESCLPREWGYFPLAIITHVCSLSSVYFHLCIYLHPEWACKTPLWFCFRLNKHWISQPEFTLIYLWQGGRWGCFVLNICFSKVAADSFWESCKNICEGVRTGTTSIKWWGQRHTTLADSTLA